MPDVRRLLVVELLGGLGDLLLVLPAVHALARAHPAARLSVLTFTPGADLLARDPHVTEVVATADHRDGAPRTAVAAALGRLRPDLVVSTTCYDGIDRLVADWVPGSVTDLWRQPPADELVDRRYLRLLAADGLIHPADVALAPKVVLDAEERAAGARRLPPGPVALLLPDAGMAVKRWPADRWRELAAALVGRGWSCVVPSEAAGATGAAVAGSAVTVLPPLSLRELAATAAACTAVVGGDTGPLRLAAAVGTPVVGLFGPTLASRYGPRAGQGLALQGLPGCAVRRPTSITEQECWWSAACPLTGGDVAACLDDITVEAVLVAVARVAPATLPG